MNPGDGHEALVIFERTRQAGGYVTIQLLNPCLNTVDQQGEFPKLKHRRRSPIKRDAHESKRPCRTVLCCIIVSSSGIITDQIIALWIEVALYHIYQLCGTITEYWNFCLKNQYGTNIGFSGIVTRRAASWGSKSPRILLDSIRWFHQISKRCRVNQNRIVLRWIQCYRVKIQSHPVRFGGIIRFQMISALRYTWLSGIVDWVNTESLPYESKSHRILLDSVASTKLNRCEFTCEHLWI